MLNNLRMLDPFKHYFGDPQGSLLGLVTALYSIGAIVSLPVTPFVADHFGRKAAIAFGCVVMVVGASVQGAAKNLTYFMAGRFMMGRKPEYDPTTHILLTMAFATGFGNSLAQLSSPLLLTELCHPQHRGRLTAVYNCLWNVGAITCTWLTFGTKRISSDWCWRVPALLQAFPSIVQLIFIFFIPESPRWLIAKGRNEEALNILGKYHANGDLYHPTVQYEFHEIKETLRIEFQYQKSSSYLDFFRTRGNRYRLMLLASLGLFSQWSVSNVHVRSGCETLLTSYLNVVGKWLDFVLRDRRVRQHWHHGQRHAARPQRRSRDDAAHSLGIVRSARRPLWTSSSVHRSYGIDVRLLCCVDYRVVAAGALAQHTSWPRCHRDDMDMFVCICTCMDGLAGRIYGGDPTFQDPRKGAYGNERLHPSRVGAQPVDQPVRVPALEADLVRKAPVQCTGFVPKCDLRSITKRYPGSSSQMSSIVTLGKTPTYSPHFEDLR
jgi:MFS family permease